MVGIAKHGWLDECWNLRPCCCHCRSTSCQDRPNQRDYAKSATRSRRENCKILQNGQRNMHSAHQSTNNSKTIQKPVKDGRKMKNDALATQEKKKCEMPNDRNAFLRVIILKEARGVQWARRRFGHFSFSKSAVNAGVGSAAQALRPRNRDQRS